MAVAIYIPIVLVTVTAALFVVFSRSVFNSALALIVTMCTLAVNFLLMRAQLIALVQILVYAGAIMVLFLFVIMLLNIRQKEEPGSDADRKLNIAFILTGIFIVQIIIVGFAFFGIAAVPEDPLMLSEAVAQSEQALQQATGLNQIATTLFTKYLIPFELTSILLLVAIIGAITVGLKDPLKAAEREEQA